MDRERSNRFLQKASKKYWNKVVVALTSRNKSSRISQIR